MIVFENIDTKETIGIDRKTEGKFYRAKLSAVMNSSNLSPNADRGQDFGWRLIPEQQALIERWEMDPEMIERVSQWSKTMVDDLTHTEFLAYLLYQQELGRSPEKSQDGERRNNQRDYEARVEALRSAERVEAVPAFDNSKVKRGEATVDDFLNGDVTGDASGDKVVEDEAESLGDDALAELDRVIDEVESNNAAADKVEEQTVAKAPEIKAPEAPQVPADDAKAEPAKTETAPKASAKKSSTKK